MSDCGNLCVPSTVAENDLLRDLAYPTAVSRHVLDRISFDSLIDAGSGFNTSLAEYVVNERHATYTGFDLIDGAVDYLISSLGIKNIPARVFAADILNVPQEIGHADVVHERFVFMYLASGKMWQQAFSNLLSIANQYVILVEYNWRTATSIQNPELMDRFKKLSFEFFEAAHIDPYAGETMQDMVRRTIPGDRLEIFHDQRPEEDHTASFASLCETQSKFASALNKPSLSRKLAGLASRISAPGFWCTPPETVVAVIRV